MTVAFVAIFGLFLSLPDNFAFAQQNATHQTNNDKLEQVRRQIESLRNTLAKSKDAKTDQHQQLETIERRIGTQARLIHAVEQQIMLQQNELHKLYDREQSLTQGLEKQQSYLARQVRANYELGQQEFLKLLLNQQSPATVTRSMTYYDYFNQARAKRISSLREQLLALHEVKLAIQNKTHALEETQTSQLKDKQALEKSRHQRKLIIAKLDKQITHQGQQLNQLVQNEQQLLQLIQRLSQEHALVPDENVSKEPFARMRGQLPWPALGNITARYGSKRNGNQRWKGVLINAKEGSDVHAISHGHVIYADWLRGFGLLMIVDHGDGYMSLYGHNESLYKETGQWVEADDVIASVGASGGFQGSGLYFEIRDHGRPIDPLTWFKKHR